MNSKVNSKLILSSYKTISIYYNVKPKFFLLLVDFIILRHINCSHNFTPYYFDIYIRSNLFPRAKFQFGVNGYVRSNFDLMGFLRGTKLDWLLKGTINRKDLTILKHSLLWPNLLLLEAFWPQLLWKVGLCTNLMLILPTQAYLLRKKYFKILSIMLLKSSVVF